MAQAADDPLANSGHFFGMTTLGATDPFHDNAATTLHYPFHEIPPETYMHVFEQHKLGCDSDIAQTLQVDGGNSILRGKLGQMLNEILCRQAHKAELQAWFTFCDYDRGCTMTRAEYEQAVHLLCQFSGNPQKARQYSSFDRWRADHMQHRKRMCCKISRLQPVPLCCLTGQQLVTMDLEGEVRWGCERGAWPFAAACCRRVEWDAQMSLQEPITATQQIGWHAAKPHAAPQEERFPLSRTDVTLKEGRSAATYYGYMTLL